MYLSMHCLKNIINGYRMPGPRLGARNTERKETKPLCLQVVRCLVEEIAEKPKYYNRLG